RLWPAAGVALAANDSILDPLTPLPDGAGGAFVVFAEGQRYFGRFPDVLVQHVTSTGAIASGWPANGKSVAPGGAYGFGAVPTDDGFLLMGWVGLGGRLRLVRLTAAGGYAAGWDSAGLVVGGPSGIDAGASGAPDGAGGAYLCWGEENSLMLTRVSASG